MYPFRVCRYSAVESLHWIFRAGREKGREDTFCFRKELEVFAGILLGLSSCNFDAQIVLNWKGCPRITSYFNGTGTGFHSSSALDLLYKENGWKELLKLVLRPSLKDIDNSLLLEDFQFP